MLVQQKKLVPAGPDQRIPCWGDARETGACAVHAAALVVCLALHGHHHCPAPHTTECGPKAKNTKRGSEDLSQSLNEPAGLKLMRLQRSWSKCCTLEFRFVSQERHRNLYTVRASGKYIDSHFL